MSIENNEQRCICCKHLIVGRRSDADYCKNCKQYLRKSYSTWRMSEKRTATNEKKFLDELKKKGYDKSIVKNIKKFFQEEREKEKEEEFPKLSITHKRSKLFDLSNIK